jgi:hypothetical protein
MAKYVILYIMISLFSENFKPKKDQKKIHVKMEIVNIGKVVALLMKWFVIDIYTTFTFPILKGSRRNRRMKKFLRSQNTFTEAKTANLFYTQSNSVANDKKTWHQKLSSLSLWPWPLSHSHKSYNNVYRILSTLRKFDYE